MNLLALKSPCKINLLLNVLGLRDDGFHELETIIHPVPIFDELHLERGGQGVQLTCSDNRLAVDKTNLINRAALAFLEAVGATEGATIHLQKNLPLAAGIGGGSANAAYTLRGLNEIWGSPLNGKQLNRLATGLGSDVPFFLGDGAAMAIGRGEQIQPLKPFPALQDVGLLIVNPGFGVSTPWAYQHLADYPEILNGQPGRAQELVKTLSEGTLTEAAELFCNSLETPVFAKHTVLPVICDFLRDNGAVVALMSGSGATIFALTYGRFEAELLRVKYHEHFGQAGWSQTVLI